MKSTTLKIEGMRCKGCAQTVKSLVEHEPGVKAIEVSFSDREARILFDAQATSEEWLVVVIQGPGFKVVDRQ
ncbi:MAG: heavy-metal-associated domain-containing protein [Candidatus Acidiferrales bacterium]